MPRAYNLLRPLPWYRHDAFSRGLKAVGYDVVEDRFEPAGSNDVLLIWNRYGGRHDQAQLFERQGGTVLVAENGFIGAGGSEPKFDVHPSGPQPHHYYALAKRYHHGRGEWPTCGPERFAALGIELKPWRTQGEHVLICPNRSFGVPPQVMPQNWAEEAALRCSKQTRRPVRIRRHPGNDAPKRRIQDDLAGAWAVVVWSSNVALHALAAGIPCYIEAPFHVVKGASASGTVDEPIITERLPHFQRMAGAQWTLKEIECGEPFRLLLPSTQETEVS